MGGFCQLGGVEVDIGEEKPAFVFHRVVDRVHHLCGCTAVNVGHGLPDNAGAFQDDRTMLLSI
ncbi:hypothetical protein D3C85_916060 [compost metagenome]